VEAICASVGGLPLGIEIAASLVRVMTCDEIALELNLHMGEVASPRRDLPEGHRSLRAVFERSWSLLAPNEQTALMRLSIYQGGFSRDAALMVSAVPFTVIMALVDKSLVKRDSSGRFHLHDVVRQFAC